MTKIDQNILLKYILCILHANVKIVVCDLKKYINSNYRLINLESERKSLVF